MCETPRRLDIPSLVNTASDRRLPSCRRHGSFNAPPVTRHTRGCSALCSLWTWRPTIPNGRGDPGPTESHHEAHQTPPQRPNDCEERKQWPLVAPRQADDNKGNRIVRKNDVGPFGIHIRCCKRRRGHTRQNVQQRQEKNPGPIDIRHLNTTYLSSCTRDAHWFLDPDSCSNA